MWRHAALTSHVRTHHVRRSACSRPAHLYGFRLVPHLKINETMTITFHKWDKDEISIELNPTIDIKINDIKLLTFTQCHILYHSPLDYQLLHSTQTSPNFFHCINVLNTTSLCQHFYFNHVSPNPWRRSIPIHLQRLVTCESQARSGCHGLRKISIDLVVFKVIAYY